MATIFVRATGSDSNNGLSKELAKLTIGSAIIAAGNGGTIYIGSGVYTETIGTITRTGVTYIGDVSGEKSSDNGIVIWRMSGASAFGTTGVIGSEFRNILFDMITSHFSLYLADATTVFKNCIFKGGLGVSTSSKLFNCAISGVNLFHSDKGVPAEVRNTIGNGTLQQSPTVGSNNLWNHVEGDGLFQDAVNNDFQVKPLYESAVKNLGVTSAGVPGYDILNVPREVTPWIGPYDISKIFKHLIKDGSDYYTINLSALELVTSVAVTSSNFLLSGFDDLNDVTNGVIGSLISPQIASYSIPGGSDTLLSVGYYVP